MELIFLLGLWRLDSPESATEGGVFCTESRRPTPFVALQLLAGPCTPTELDLAHHGVGFLPFEL